MHLGTVLVMIEFEIYIVTYLHENECNFRNHMHHQTQLYPEQQFASS